MGSKRKKKGESGEAKRYITRNAAVKKLQLSLRDFRRLCILKGIYPREPNNRRKAQKGDSTIKTLYYMKDIQFLLHEPIIWKFREHRAFSLKIKHAKAKKDRSKVRRMMQNKPMYHLDHIVRERYPTFAHALRDLDDPLTLCFLFSKLPQVHRTTLNMVNMCRRLTLEFMLYVIEAQALRKVFITIKGYYYQVEIMGQTITWITPHPFTPQNNAGVDFRIMRVFVEFYVTLLGFTNFRLYHHLNLYYPPKLPHADIKEGSEDDIEVGDPERLASLNFVLKRNYVEENDAETIDTHLLEEDATRLQEAQEEEKRKKKQQNLFKGLKLFLNRETNIESLTFIIRACKGEVSWDESTADGSTFPVTDESITHEIVDRPDPKQTYLSRYYIQPQWVYDCINARILLPVQDYFPGVTLPPHLSPFDIETHTYVPPEQKQLLARQRGEIPEDQLPRRLDSESDSEEEEEKSRKKKKSEANIRPLESFQSRTKKRKEKKRKLAQEAAVQERGEESTPAAGCNSNKEMEAMETEKAEDAKNTVLGRKAGDKEGKEGITGVEENGKEETEKPKQEKKMGVYRGRQHKISPKAAERQELEEKKLAIMMIPRKKKRVFHMLQRRERRRDSGARRLTQKRLAIDHEKEKAKKAQKAVT